MKAHFRLSIIIVALFAMLSNVACTKSSSGDSGGGSAAAASTLSLQPASVAAGGTINLIPSGGTPPYTFTLQSTIGGSLTSYATYTTLTAGTTAGGLTVTVADAAGATAISTITVGSSNTLTISPPSTTVAPGGTVTYSASGGTGSGYTYSASAGTFTGNVFTAPATAQTVTVTVADSGGNSMPATVYVSGTPVSTSSCQGSFTLTMYDSSSFAVTGSLQIIQSVTNQIGGTLGETYTDIYGVTRTGYAPISGTCNGGAVTFTNPYSMSVFTGSYFSNTTTNKTTMTGTFTYSGQTFSWIAQQQ